MQYDFSNLSPADFEDLARDLIGRALSVRFEAFAAGPDQGIDGRHSNGEDDIILQAKHFVGSRFPALKSAMKKERKSIDRLEASRYVLATSMPLSALNKAALAETIGPTLKQESDIFGVKDLEGLLRDNSDLAKMHIKLWLSGHEILERIIHSAAHAVNSISLKEIELKVRVYATNPSLTEARNKLEENHVVIISGPPGVGKSTLAEMLAYAHIAEGWDYHAIRSLDDGFAGLNDAKKQIFYFDDFLGTVALDAHALSARDSDLVRFIRRVRLSPNARFVLTTRTHLFEEARRISERLADQKLDITRYALDVGVYTRRIRARIFYNHLYVTETPTDHIRALWEAGAFEKIIDHRNYNPRVIEAMTDAFHTKQVKAADYPNVFLATLENPLLLWDTAFREHISPRCKHLLIALFFCSEYGCQQNILREVFEPLHAYLTEKYGGTRSPKDFDESLRILEGGFIIIGNRRISFVNPSLRDYLTKYLDDDVMIADFASAARKPDWADKIWRFAKELRGPFKERKALAQRFKGTLQEFLKSKVWTTSELRRDRYEKTDLSNSDRLSLLLEWWSANKDAEYATTFSELVKHPVDGFSPWLDGDNLIDLLIKLPDEDYYDPLPNLDRALDALEDAIIQVLRGGIGSDELERIADKIDEHREKLDDRIFDALNTAMRDQIDEIDSAIEDIDSESELEEHIKTVKKFAERAQASAEAVETAVSTIRKKIKALEEADTEDAESPSVSDNQALPDKFDDAELRNLFMPLLDK